MCSYDPLLCIIHPPMICKAEKISSQKVQLTICDLFLRLPSANARYMLYKLSNSETEIEHDNRDITYYNSAKGQARKFVSRFAEQLKNQIFVLREKFEHIRRPQRNQVVPLNCSECRKTTLNCFPANITIRKCQSGLQRIKTKIENRKQNAHQFISFCNSKKSSFKYLQIR